MAFVTSMDQSGCVEADVAISFFYRTGDSERGNISTTLYRSFLHQLLSRDEELLGQFEMETRFRARIGDEGSVDKMWDGYEFQLREQCEKVLNLFMRKGRKVRIYLDKIDELEEGDGKEVISWLRELRTGNDHTVSVCFASTPFTCEGLVNDFVIDVEQENARDIRLHLDQKLLLSSGLRKEAEIDVIKEAVAKRTAGIFQWLVCNINDMQNMIEGGEDVAAVLSGVNVLPTELSDAYERLMTKLIKLGKVEFAFRVLLWVAYAETPLQIKDLKYAACLDPSETCTGHSPAERCGHWHDNDNVFADRILRMLRCFLTSSAINPIETKCYEGRIKWNTNYDPDSRPPTATVGAICPGDSALQFNHESVSHFMIDRGLAMLEDQRSAKSIPRSLGSMHLSMAKVCLQHLLTIPVQKFIATRTRPGEHLLDLLKNDQECAKAIKAPAFSFYAARYWQDHFRMAETTDAPLLDLAELIMSVDIVSWGMITRATLVSICSYCPEAMLFSSPLHMMAHFGFHKTLDTILNCEGAEAGEGAASMSKMRQSCLSFIDLPDSCLVTPVFAAAGHGHRKVVDSLLQNGANINISQPETNLTPLHCAALSGHADIVRALLAHDPTTVDWKDESGHTALSIAAKNNKVELVGTLLLYTKLGVHSKALSPGLFIFHMKDRLPIGTPLTTAFCSLRSESLDTLRLLLRYGSIDRTVQDHEGQTLLHYVSDRRYQFGGAYSHFPEKSRLLIKSGRLDPNIEDNNGFTPFTYAVKLGNVDTVKHFLQADGVDYEHLMEAEYTPFNFAVLLGESSMIQTLLNSGKVDIEAKNSKGYTPYVTACYHGRLEAIHILLDSGKVNLSATGCNDFPALMFTISIGMKPKVVKYLLEAGQLQTTERYGGDLGVVMFAAYMYQLQRCEERRRVKEVVQQYVDALRGRPFDISGFENVFGAYSEQNGWKIPLDRLRTEKQPE